MKNIPTSQESVQSQDSEVTKNNNETNPRERGGADSLPDSKPHNGLEEKTADGAASLPASAGDSGGIPSEDSGSSEEDLKECEGNDPGMPDEDPAKDTPAGSEAEPGLIEKEKTIPKSIRLTESAFAALIVLMGKYGVTRVAMASICITAYAKGAAAVAIVRYRILDTKWLFPLQASATDIKEGLSKLEKDLLEARKSHRDPKERRLLYDILSEKYPRALEHAEETLTSMDKECLLHGLLKPGDHALLIQLIEKLENEEPKSSAERKIRDLQIKIFKKLVL